MEDWRKYAAEAYGTFVLVGVGTMGIIAVTAGGGGDAGVALAFGLGLTAALFTVGRISGGHFNPAVSLAMFFDKRMRAGGLAGYWVSQLAGATAASLVVASVLGRDAAAATVTALNTDLVSMAGGVGVEAVLTAIFVLTIMVVARSDSAMKFFVIGLALVAVALAGGTITGGSFNPARSFGPALVAGEWADFGVYVAGPLLGALAAAGLYRGLVAGADGA